MTESESKAIEMIAEAASILGWALMLHPAEDEVNVAAITVGELSFLESFEEEVITPPTIH